ncbi:MAG TPA: hypothetical protein VL359_19060 [bacterium]|nr:hypothetical protein [bacterium]
MAVMLPQSQAPQAVNPYSRWIYDHPRSILAHPTPEQLHALRHAALGAGDSRLPAPPAPWLGLDLGCGSGQYLLRRAASQPQAHWVGFELRYKRLVKAARKLEKLGLPHVWLLREVAERCGDYFAPGAVDEICINFPDPWPRPSQWKKRLIQEGFLADVARLLRGGGSLAIKTDHSGYFLHVLAETRRVLGWPCTGFSNDVHRSLPRADAPSAACLAPAVAPPETEFEQLFRAQGKPVFYLRLVKPGDERRSLSAGSEIPQARA